MAATVLEVMDALGGGALWPLAAGAVALALVAALPAFMQRRTGARDLH